MNTRLICIHVKQSSNSFSAMFTRIGRFTGHVEAALFNYLSPVDQISPDGIV